MAEKKEILTLEEYIQTFIPPTSSWLSWMFGTVKDSMRRWLGSSSNVYVVIPTVKELAKRVLNSYYQKPVTSWTDHLLTFSDFRARFGFLDDVPLTDQDIWLLLRYLSSQMGVSIAEDVKGYGTSYVVR